MNIVGNGFLARNLRPLENVHPGVVVLAAGVPRQGLPAAAHEREARLVRDAVQRCRASGELLVFFSSTSMYGEQGGPGREDGPPVPASVYGRHKKDLEELIAGSGVDHLTLRLTQVIGPGEPDFRLLPAIISQLRAGHVRLYHGARRDLLHVADFVDLLDALLNEKVRNEVVNIASGCCLPIVDIVDHLEKRLSLTAEREILPGGVSYCASVEKLHRLIPGPIRGKFAPDYGRRTVDRYLEETGLARHSERST